MNNSLLPAVSSFLLSLNIPTSTLSSNTLSPSSILQVRAQVHIMQNYGQNYGFVYFSFLRLQIADEMTEGSELNGKMHYWKLVCSQFPHE